jgi:hypothetical protein
LVSILIVRIPVFREECGKKESLMEKESMLNQGARLINAYGQMEKSQHSLINDIFDCISLA